MGEAPVVERPRARVQARIVEAAADLLARGGRDAVTTRAVAAEAGVQAPTIYRLFGDKDGLLDAVAEYGFRTYLTRKLGRSTGGDPSSDPVEDLRTGWDLHVGFGLAHPALYVLMYGDPRPGAPSAAAVRSQQMLRAHVRAVAEVGRLRVGEEQAVNLFHAAAAGTVLTLLAMPEAGRDPALSELARDTAVAAITTDAPALASPGPAGAAIALRSLLDDGKLPDVLTAGERALLREWLDRVVGARPPT